MLERRSALAMAKPYKSSSLQIGEARGFSLLQVVAEAKALSKIAGKLPEKVGLAIRQAERTVMRTGANQYWFIGAENDDLETKLRGTGVLTPLSHSRTRIVIERKAARTVLTKSAPLDFHASVFTPGMFAMTGIHHTPVLIHCVSDNRFEIFALRTFALGVHDWLVDAALEFAE